MVKGGLSLLFMDEEHKKDNSTIMEEAAKPVAERAKPMKNKMVNYIEDVETSKNVFKVPLHYPRYTKEEYENMSELTLNFLLDQYIGLPVGHDLGSKRKHAIDAFLWPSPSSSSSSLHGSSSITLHQDSNSQAKKKSSTTIIGILCRVLGF